METLIKGRVGLWTALLQFAALLIAGAATFVLEPAIRFDQTSDEFPARPYLNFVLTIIFICLFIWLRTTRQRATERTLAGAAILLLAAASSSMFAYDKVSDRWSCRLEQERYVIAAKVLPAMKAKSPNNSCIDWFNEMNGHLDQVWDVEEVRDRHQLLLLWYLATVLGFALSALVAIEALNVHLGGIEVAGRVGASDSSELEL